ncbi:hypothetical protein J3459_007729 [Metarhizium acridum]|nr:hypothetical protein J3459_007729 [Metarhizium acridum]
MFNSFIHSLSFFLFFISLFFVLVLTSYEIPVVEATDGKSAHVQEIPKQLQIIRNPDSGNRKLRSCRAAVFGGVFFIYLVKRIVCVCRRRAEHILTLVELEAV